MNAHELNALSGATIGAAIAVHRELGPGLDEDNYEVALCAELLARGIGNRRQFPVPVVYKSVRLDVGYRLDLLVEGSLVVELKSIDVIHPNHEAQLLTYLRLSGCTLGLLLNFDVPVLKEGIRRRVVRFGEDAMGAAARPPVPRLNFATTDGSDELSDRVIGAAIEVHRHLGPGLLKSAYHECLCYELSVRALPFERRKPLAVRFREINLPKSAEIDLIVAGELPLMVVSVAEITPLLEARLIGRLRNGGWGRGLLLNFGEQTLGAGVRRLVNATMGGIRHER